MRGAKDQIFFAELFEVGYLSPHPVDQQLGGAYQVGIDHSCNFIALLEDDCPGFQTVKDFIPDADVEVTGQ